MRICDYTHSNTLYRLSWRSQQCASSSPDGQSALPSHRLFVSSHGYGVVAVGRVVNNGWVVVMLTVFSFGIGRLFPYLLQTVTKLWFHQPYRLFPNHLCFTTFCIYSINVTLRQRVQPTEIGPSTLNTALINRRLECDAAACTLRVGRDWRKVEFRPTAR